jgi:hypothetical protein
LSATTRACSGARGRAGDHELVAALARDGVDLAHAETQAARDVLQDEVAAVVAERVVHHLEAVEVEEEHRDVALLAPRGS